MHCFFCKLQIRQHFSTLLLPSSIVRSLLFVVYWLSVVINILVTVVISFLANTVGQMYTLIYFNWMFNTSEGMEEKEIHMH